MSVDASTVCQVEEEIVDRSGVFPTEFEVESVGIGCLARDHRKTSTWSDAFLESVDVVSRSVAFPVTSR